MRNDVVNFGEMDRRVILVEDGDVIYRLPGGCVSFLSMVDWQKHRDMTVVKRAEETTK